ncbi:MAG: hypothetical protein NT169_07620 [Chloroflexi bacterium]|nr:hypothetical protein [Chloroflexota bacterium]
MNILDENIPDEQRVLLVKWRMPFRQIGFESGRKGMKDTEIIPFLQTLGHPTFFTRDVDFWKRSLYHLRYCLVFLNIEDDAVAFFAHRLLRHPQFDTQIKRMGAVIRVSHEGLSAWRLHAAQEAHHSWIDADGRALSSALREDEAFYVTGLPADDAAETKSTETSL